MPFESLLLIVLAGAAAGMVNALAGGGTLISFPALTALGLPAIAANITSTVALCPGFLGASLAQAKDLQGQKQRMILLLPVAIAGGILGAMLLLKTEERAFRSAVPFLLLIAAALLALQKTLRKWIVSRAAKHSTKALPEWIAIVPVGLAAVYGGYFGAGMSVIMLAVLGLLIDDTLTRLNALKQTISLSLNVAAAIVFVFSKQIVWPAAIALATGALAGGAVGGRLAGRINAEVLRWTIVAIGVAMAVLYAFANAKKA